MDEKERKRLLDIARSAISGNIPPLEEREESYGAFVTIRKNGELRGCIGYLAPVMGIEQQIAHLAREAAFSDPRFPPMENGEIQECSIEISLLTAPKKIETFDEFVLGRDGIIMTLFSHRAVYLPQVANETGWNKEELLSSLSMKAGLMQNAWKNENAEFEIFQAEVFSDSDL